MLTNTYNMGSVKRCHIVPEYHGNLNAILIIEMEVYVELNEVKCSGQPIATGIAPHDPVN